MTICGSVSWATQIIMKIYPKIFRKEFTAGLLSEAIVPVLRAVEATRVVGINAGLFARVDQGIVQDRQSFVSAGIFPNIFVPNKHILAGTRVFNSGRSRELELAYVNLAGLRCCLFGAHRGLHPGSSHRVFRSGFSL